MPATQGTTFPLTYVVTGGTGQFQGKGGSGTGTIARSTPPPNIALTLTLTENMNSQPGLTASINPGGIVPIGHSRVTIQPGSWLSIYGKNFTGATTIRDGVSTNIPTNLEGIAATLRHAHIEHSERFGIVPGPNQSGSPITQPAGRKITGRRDPNFQRGSL